MDEHMTSRICSCCNAEREAAAKKCANQKFEASRRKSARRANDTSRLACERILKFAAPVDPMRQHPRPQTLIRGALLCKSCGDRPLFWHRDVNAARNILAVYVCL